MHTFGQDVSYLFLSDLGGRLFHNVLLSHYVLASNFSPTFHPCSRNRIPDRMLEFTDRKRVNLDHRKQNSDVDLKQSGKRVIATRLGSVSNSLADFSIQKIVNHIKSRQRSLGFTVWHKVFFASFSNQPILFLGREFGLSSPRS